MPLSIQIPYRGDQYLFQGISSAGQGIGEGIEAMTKRLRQTKAMRTMAVDGLGMDADKVDQMSPEQIQGMMQGIAVKQAQAEAQARRQMDLAHADYFQRFNKKAAADEQFSQVVSQYMQPRTMPEGVQGPPSMPSLDPQTLMRLEAESGTLDPDKAMQYMRQLDPATRGFFNSNGAMAEDIPGVPGAKRVVTGPNQSEILRVNGEAPDAPPGYQMVADGKGGWKPVKIDIGTMSPGERARIQMQHEKGIDELVKSLPFAQGDPEMTAIIKERIAAHKAGIAELNAPAAKTNTPAAGGGAKEKQAVGGYKIGTVYGGLKYLGGEPTESANWEKVK